MKSFNKILVANRGEIAVRIIKTLKKMNIISVAVHSAADSNALFVRMADESFLLPGESLTQTYLNADLIIKIALDTESQAVHPGYGFLSENAVFAEKINESGLVFIGPSPESISLMGNKSQARILAADLNIPLIKGFDGKVDDLICKSGEFNYPLLIKAAAGGGGKAMLIVHNPADLKSSLELAAGEAKRYFGNDLLYVEQYFESARHIEVQVLVDQNGEVFIPGDRECSIQRRYQKVIEEAPSPSLNKSLRKELHATAKKICQAINYRNAGTLEFLVDDYDNFYFLEMNTRIQVEHAVTELTSNIDIVEMQVKIAAGKLINISSETFPLAHAIEARIYAEDPQNGFMPSAGKIYSYSEPVHPKLRIDSGIDGPAEINADYDPLIAKISATGLNREEAIKNLLEGLNNYQIAGFVNNMEFLSGICRHKDFVRNKISTSWLEKNREAIINQINQRKESFSIPVILSFWLTSVLSRKNSAKLWQWQSDRFRRNNLSYSVKLFNKDYLVKILFHDTERIKFSLNKVSYKINLLKRRDDKISLTLNNELYEAFVSKAGNHEDMVSINGLEFRIRPSHYLPEKPHILSDGKDQTIGLAEITSPLHGKIVKLNVSVNDEVRKGDSLVSVEAMKMENRILAPSDGFIKDVLVSVGDQVSANQRLITIKNE